MSSYAATLEKIPPECLEQIVREGFKTSRHLHRALPTVSRTLLERLQNLNLSGGLRGAKAKEALEQKRFKADGK